jgi:hypothetical protein
VESLKANLTKKNGVLNAWNFENFHRIMPKVIEIQVILRFRLSDWSENFSTQGPEHCHMDLVKKIEHCTNNKEVFLTGKANLRQVPAVLDGIEGQPVWRRR